MSGGHFDYQQHRIGDIADTIQGLIDNNHSDALDRYGYPLAREYGPEIIAAFEQAVDALRVANVYAQRVDWLVSGDDSEESFLRRLAEDLAEARKTGGAE